MSLKYNSLDSLILLLSVMLEKNFVDSPIVGLIIPYLIFTKGRLVLFNKTLI